MGKKLLMLLGAFLVIYLLNFSKIGRASCRERV